MADHGSSMRQGAVADTTPLVVDPQLPCLLLVQLAVFAWRPVLPIVWYSAWQLLPIHERTLAFLPA